MPIESEHRAEECQSGVSTDINMGQKDNTDAVSTVLINKNVTGKTKSTVSFGNATSLLSPLIT